MSERPASNTVDDETLQNQLLEWLGLPAEASQDDVEATHERLLGFLDSAPLVLQPWARRQVNAANAAKSALVAPADETDRQADSEALTAALAGPPAAAPGAAALRSTHFDDDAFEQPQTPTADAPAAPVTTSASGSTKRNPTTAILLALLIVAVVVGVYFMGGGGQDPAGEAASPTAAASAPAAVGGATPVPVDPEQVKALTAKVEANPKDTASMRELANMYFGAADFTNSATWQAKVLEVTPEDIEARLALGASEFNGGDPVEAEKHWREVLKRDPKNAEAHYSLGFLHLSKNPPEIDQAEAEWAKVAELAPGSEIAKTATAHLERLKSMATVAPGPGAGTSGSAATTPAQGRP